MQYSFICESAGRDLVGAGKYASRSSVVNQLLQKYPNPSTLATALNSLAKKTTTVNPKLAKEYFSLAQQCSSVSNQEYPKFLKKVAGLSSLWSTTAKVAGGAVAAAGLAYLARTAIKAYNDPMSRLSSEDQNNIKNIDDPEEQKRSARAIINNGGAKKSFLNRMGDQVKSDYQTAKGLAKKDIWDPFKRKYKQISLQHKANKALAKAQAEDQEALNNYINRPGSIQDKVNKNAAYNREIATRLKANSGPKQPVVKNDDSEINVQFPDEQYIDPDEQYLDNTLAELQ